MLRLHVNMQYANLKLIFKNELNVFKRFNNTVDCNFNQITKIPSIFNTVNYNAVMHKFMYSIYRLLILVFKIYFYLDKK